jgi:hypothetical protein
MMEKLTLCFYLFQRSYENKGCGFLSFTGSQLGSGDGRSASFAVLLGILGRCLVFLLAHLLVIRS